MNRIVDAGHSTAIRQAFEQIPEGIRARLGHVEFLTGVDPVFAGLHGYELTGDGRTYREIAHCAYPIHTSDRSTTIVLPTVEEPWVIVHELAHALDWSMGATHRADPVTWYGKTNRQEAFAEAFTAWRYEESYEGTPWRYSYVADGLELDGATRALFEVLARG